VTIAQRGPRSLRHLARVHGRSLSSVLVLRGTTAGRDQVAREFHAAGAHPAAPFQRLDCAADETVLNPVLRSLLSDAESSRPSPEDQRRTLFLDAVEALTKNSQRLLLLVIDRLAEVAPWGGSRPIGRLIAGSQTELEKEVDAGRFLPELYDAVNKVRVDLGHEPAPPERTTS
jgi:DNA-binding NtrC family response regulator